MYVRDTSWLFVEACLVASEARTIMVADPTHLLSDRGAMLSDMAAVLSARVSTSINDVRQGARYSYEEPVEQRHPTCIDDSPAVVVLSMLCSSLASCLSRSASCAVQGDNSSAVIVLKLPGWLHVLCASLASLMTHLQWPCWQSGGLCCVPAWHHVRSRATSPMTHL